MLPSKTPEPPPLLLKEGQAPRCYQPTLAPQEAAGQRASSPRQGSPTRERGPKGRQQSQKQSLKLLFGFHMNTKMHNDYTCVENLFQSHAGFLVVSSVSVGPYGRRLLDSVDVLLLDPSILPPPSSTGFPKVSLMFGCDSLHLFPLAGCYLNTLRWQLC